MGYRSDIKIIAGKKAAAEFRKVNKKYGLFTETDGENGEWLFEAEYLKWYEISDEYPDVAAYMEVVNKYTAMKLKGAPAGCGFLYYRQGEDSGDIDSWDNGGVNAYVATDIQVVGFTKKVPKPNGKQPIKDAFNAFKDLVDAAGMELVTSEECLYAKPKGRNVPPGKWIELNATVEEIGQ